MPGLFKKLILLVILLSILSCNNDKVETGKISVAVTIPPYKYLVEKIGGKEVEIITSIPVGATPHHFEPTPKLIQSISSSRYYFAAGRSMEFEDVWLNKLKGVNPNLKVINLSENIEYVNNDPHVWLSPSRLKIITANIYNSLAEIFPGKTNYFKENYNALIDSINIVEKELIQAFKNLKSNKLLVYHGSWVYFADDFGFKQISIEQGSKSASAKEFKSILDEVKRDDIPVIFIDPQHSKASAEVVARDLNIKLETIDPIPADLLVNFIDVKNKILKYYK